MTIKFLSLTDISDNPWQMWALDPAKVSKLAEGYQANDPIPPIVVRADPKQKGKYQCAVGHHRRAARALMGALDVTAEVTELTDLEMATLAIKENFDRGVPTALDKARAAERLAAPPFKQSNEQIAAVLGLKDPSSVTNLRRLLKLPTPMQEMVERGQLPERLARQLVRVAATAPKEVTELAGEIVKAPASERDTALVEGLADILDEHAQPMWDASFPVEFPAQPIPVAKPAGDQPAELRACVGCEFFFKHERSGFCLRKACFELKEAAYVEQALANLSQRLNVPLATPDEKVALLFDDSSANYHQRPQAIKLLAAAAKQPALGLRLVPRSAYPKARFVWWVSGILGEEGRGRDEFSALATTDKAAVNKFLAALEDGQSAGKAAVPTNGKAPTAAEAEKQKAIDAELREEKRAERAAKQRAERDVIWLVHNFVEQVAPQLQLGASGLAYINHNLVHADYYRAGAWLTEDGTGLKEWIAQLEEQATKAKGKEADALHRRLFVVGEVSKRLPYNGATPDALADMRESLLALAQNKPDEDGEEGFSLKLPAGWDKPPIHHTAYNCWQCGAFAGGPSRKLSGKDQSAGWTVAADGRVTCPTHSLSVDKAKAKPVDAPVDVAELTRENIARIKAAVKARKAKPPKPAKKRAAQAKPVKKAKRKKGKRK